MRHHVCALALLSPLAFNHAFARGADEVDFQLDGGEAARTFRQVRNAGIAACGSGQRDHAAGVQISIRRQVRLLHA